MKLDELRRGLDDAGRRPGIDLVDARAAVGAKSAGRRHRKRHLVVLVLGVVVVAVALPIAVGRRDPSGTAVRVAPQPIERVDGWAQIRKESAGLPASSSSFGLASTRTSLLLAGWIPIHPRFPLTDDSWRPAIWYSDDGLTWQTAHVPTAVRGLVRAIAASGDTALAIGDDSASRTFVWQSDDDGRTWQTVAGGDGLSGPGGSVVTGLMYAHRRWIASGIGSTEYGAGARAAVWTSTDGRNWQQHFFSTPEEDVGIPEIIDDGDGHLLAHADNLMWTSADGTRWSRRVVASVPDGFVLGPVAPGGSLAFGDSPSSGSKPTPLLRRAGGSRSWSVDPTFLAHFPGARVGSVFREDDLWIATGWSGSSRHPDAWISADGISWRSMPASLYDAPGTLTLAGSVDGRLVMLAIPRNVDRAYVDRFYTFDAFTRGSR